MQCIQYFVYDLQRYLPRCTGLSGIGKGHGGAKGFAGKAAHRAQSSHAHGDDGSLRMPVGHFSGGSQKLQHIGTALGHHSQFGQIGPGLLHGNHAAHQFGARRRFMEVVAGTHHCSPGGVGFFDQRGKLCARSEKFNVDQIGAVGGKNGADKMKILFVGQSDFTAFGFCVR